MSESKEFKKGRNYVVVGFFVSLLYYTVVIGGPIYFYGVFIIFSSNSTRLTKILWTLIPAILWWPTCLLLIFLVYKLNI